MNYEGLREAKALGDLSILVPTALQRSGDFSSYLTGSTVNLCGNGGPANLNFDSGQLFDPGTITQFTCPSGSTILVGDPIAGNIITSIDPVAQKVLAAYPDPNASGAHNYLNAIPQYRNDDQWLARMDHIFNDRDRLSGRYIYGNSNLVLPFDYSSIPEFGRKNTFRGQNVGLTWTHAFAGTLLNEARFGFQRNWAWRGGQNVPREAGFMASFGIDNFQAIGPEYEAFPFFGISGFGSVGDAATAPLRFPTWWRNIRII